MSSNVPTSVTADRFFFSVEVVEVVVEVAMCDLGGKADLVADLVAMCDFLKKVTHSHAYNTRSFFFLSHFFPVSSVRFRRRTFHEPNLIQIMRDPNWP